jgi:hypothetical protein
LEGYGPLRLDAYAATDLTNQLVTDIPAGSWNFYNFAFLIPTVVNGKVYVASGGELDVFGLGPTVSAHSQLLRNLDSSTRAQASQMPKLRFASAAESNTAYAVKAKSRAMRLMNTSRAN